MKREFGKEKTFMEKKDIKSLYLEELEEELGQLGEKSFRAKQIYQWVHQKLAADFEDMSNLSKALREKLASAVYSDSIKSSGGKDFQD